MKAISILLLSLVLSIFSFSQSKKDVMDELKKIQERIETLQRTVEVNKAQTDERINALEKEITILRIGNTTSREPIDNKGSKNNSSDSSYKYNSNLKSNSVPDKQLKSGDGLTPTTGATIYTGPRGGQYYINKNGNKTYIKKRN